MKHKLFARAARPLIALALIIACTIPVALADTDGTELQITGQPDRLILQLGPKWAGVQFELKTDAGTFPVPVVVSETGVLEMDLGGSKNYILSCLDPSVAIPAPGESGVPEPVLSGSTAESTPAPTPAPAKEPFSIPILPLVLFGGGLVLAVGGLVVMRTLKNRQRCAPSCDDDSDEDDAWY